MVKDELFWKISNRILAEIISDRTLFISQLNYGLQTNFFYNQSVKTKTQY